MNSNPQTNHPPQRWTVTGAPSPRMFTSLMPKYVIERDLPGAGKMTADQLQAVSQKSCSVLEQLGPKVQWLHSYVTDDKIYCIYVAESEQLIREHAKRGGFPANRVSAVRTIIDPTTAERQANTERVLAPA